MFRNGCVIEKHAQLRKIRCPPPLSNLTNYHFCMKICMIHLCTLLSIKYYGYFYSMKLTFLRLSKVIVNRLIAQWVSAISEEGQI